MDSRQYHQAFLDLQAFVVDRCRTERYAMLNEVMESYSHCLTRSDRLEFVQVNLVRFRYRLESILETGYESHAQFCEAHLQLVRSSRKRLLEGWHLWMPQHIDGYASEIALKATIDWLEQRLKLVGAKARNGTEENDPASGQLPIITIVPPELIGNIGTVLGQYLTPASRVHIWAALRNGPSLEPLVINSQVNRFIEAFAQLSEAGIIKENKQQIRAWLLLCFLQQKGHRQEPLKPHSIWDYLTKRAKKPANPINVLQAIGWRTPVVVI